MSDDKVEAVDRISDFVKIAIKGWPIYGVIAAMLWGYGELWLDAKIAAAIKTQTLEQPAIVQVTGVVAKNEQAIGEIKSEVSAIKGDTTAILLHLAGAND